jgi:hypothetical protein
VKLPGGEEIHRLLTDPENPQTYRAIGERYDASGAAVHKMYKNWAERNGVEWRKRPVRNAE